MAATRSLDAGERLDWLRLWRSENVGPVTFFQLLERYGSAAAALAALPELAQRGGRRRPLRLASAEAAERELEAAQRLGASLVAHGEAAYPPALTEIADAPPLLTVLGQPALLARPGVAIVGARNASANGCALARQLAEQAAAAGLLVVSGMARGIDSHAHRGALAQGTAAVLAGGADVVYPAENEDLYAAIREHGAVLSEMPLGRSPQGRHFPLRNRIIAGMARGVCVVEAALRSGSLITARYAGEQGREVLAVPGSPLDPRARGTNALIRDGATLVETGDDIVEALTAISGRALREPRASPRVADPAPDATGDADGVRQRVVAQLGPTPVAVDLLVRHCAAAPAAVQAVLLELELAGQIERHAGNRVALKPPDSAG